MNRKIAKNTLMLYMRMFLTLIVGLYTSRVILNSLGFSDYGIYNVVGGVVSMLAFLNVGMAGASQRFISFSLGKGDIKDLRNVFCTSVITHISLAFLIAVILETIGLWFLNYKMNIPSNRIFAANCVFQFSILTLVASVISVPYNSCIIAHEKMSAFAYISIFETIAKLCIAFFISGTSFDKLIFYSFLLLTLQVIIRFIYGAYCKRNFEECVFKYTFDKVLFKKMFSFAGWGCIGNMGFSLKDQGSNVLLNLFFGTTVNAARGIATQVNGIVSQFASNFTMAMNPQITKTYASGNIVESQKLAYEGSKYAFYLLSLISIPLLINIQYVLRFWLGKVPPYTDKFVIIIILCSIVYSLTHTISTSILATGKVKVFQSLLAFILLLELPIAYVILLFGGKPYYALLPAIFTNFASLIMRIVLLHRMIPEYNLRDYFYHIVLRCMFVLITSLGLSCLFRLYFDSTLLSVCLTSSISFVLVFVIIYVIGLNSTERIKINEIIKKKLNM